MNKVLIVIMFILLGTSLIIVSNMNKGVENSFTIEYQNNKNLNLPALTGKTEISNGLYRLHNANGVTLDYELNTGVFTINGTKTSNFSYIITDYIPKGQYTLSYQYLSGSLNGDLYIGNSGQWNISINNNSLNYEQNKQVTNTQTVQTRLYFDFTNSNTFNDYKFKMQFEKGGIATSYVVPKLIPLYKDNLTEQEKNNIGIGAFGGITKIIKTISDIIKPVGDFINGLLSLF